MASETRSWRSYDYYCYYCIASLCDVIHRYFMSHVISYFFCLVQAETTQLGSDAKRSHVSPDPPQFPIIATAVLPVALFFRNAIPAVSENLLYSLILSSLSECLINTRVRTITGVRHVYPFFFCRWYRLGFSGNEAN